MSFLLTDATIADDNRTRLAALGEDYGALARTLARRGVDIEAMTARAAAFRVAVPSWGVGTGGTRFGRFPGPGEPQERLREGGRLRRHPGPDAASRRRSRSTSRGTGPMIPPRFGSGRPTAASR